MEVTPALIHAVALSCKAHSTLAGIDSYFIFAGADPKSRAQPAPFSKRDDLVHAWVEGIQAHDPQWLGPILEGVMSQLLEDPEISGEERARLQAFLGVARAASRSHVATPASPSDIDALLDRLIRGLPRAMFPLQHRRAPKTSLEFTDEYDVQDLFHSQLRPWISDIRTEEYTPSYTRSSTRIDFLLPAHSTFIELKFVRKASHARSYHQELTIDIAHYAKHPDAKRLLVIVYDPSGHISNPDGMSDISGSHVKDGRSLEVLCYIVGGPHQAAAILGRRLP